MVQATHLWVAAPDVIADPFQVDEGRIWAQSFDVLPGVRIVPGRPVVAAWDDLTFRADAEWDPDEPTTLWLDRTGVATSAPVPDRDSVAGLLDGARRGHARAWSRLTGYLEDLQQTVEVLVRALRAARADVARALDAVEHLPADQRQAMTDHPAIAALYAFARRTPATEPGRSPARPGS